MPLIELHDVRKTYQSSSGEVRALDGLDLAVEEGTVRGLLGPNGAGKTTCVKVLTTLIRPTSGTATVAGLDVVRQAARVREIIGASGQYATIDEDLSARENLMLIGRLFHLGDRTARTRADELLELFNLTDAADRPVKGFSGGMRRRADLASSLVNNPKILFLDEPTAGLDPGNRNTVWRTIHELRERTGLTVFLTTHYMEETEEADHVCVIDHGRIIAQGTPAELRAKHSSSILTLTTEAGTRDLEVADAAEARRILAERGEAVLDFEFRHGRMDDVFIALTGGADDAEDREAR